ncbi:spore protease YyaC [Maledivibacter halophilus]|uniref:Putative sporulation protein YyaC n=1 Tax=Maledivibacter halophilus TaxID=36842 RepID=A0A1T5MLJ2_9FIRM|nr:spore protease YyaC [Maledivibacter halophilus]SKC88923.1 putative sporulation protein YyaC [Maledivibacter halophilus]
MNSISKLSENTVNINNPLATSYFSNIFLSYLKNNYTSCHDEIIILCIGTDRSTGDSLGPLTGYKIKKILNRFEKVHVYGTLNEPVHAKNLEEKIENIYSDHKNPFVIAIDACLGKVDRVGYITVSQGPIKPGAGVKKVLPPVGDIHITGIVNLGGFMEYIVLQNTRLNLVMNMAETISSAIYFGLWKFYKEINKKIEQLNLS